MKRSNAIKFLGIIAVAMALFLSGCGTKVQTLVYDKPIPENQAATLIIPAGYTVTGFNGERVNWAHTITDFTLASIVAAIKIPSGSHSIAYSYYWHYPSQTTYEQHGNVRIQRTTRARTVSFDGKVAITMDAGKKYIFEDRGIVLDTKEYEQLP